MRSIAEFAAGRAALEQRVGRMVRVVSLCLLLALVLLITSKLWPDALAGRRLVISCSILVGLLIVALAGLGRADPRLACPHCRKAVNAVGFAGWIIATRNCCFCGGQMLGEPGDASDDKPLLSADELRAATKTAGHVQTRWLSGTMIALVAWAALHAASHMLLLSWVSANINEVYAELLLFAATTPLLGLALFVIWRRWGDSGGQPGPRCPHCQAALLRAGMIVLTTGNCAACGRRVLDQPSCAAADAHEPADLPSIPEFAAASRAEGIKALLLVFASVGSLLGLLWLGLILAEMLPGGQRRPPEGLAAVAAFGPALVAGAITVLAIAAHARDFDQRLTCPGCKANLVGNVPAVIATRRCLTCGRRVLAAGTLPRDTA